MCGGIRQRKEVIVVEHISISTGRQKVKSPFRMRPLTAKQYSKACFRARQAALAYPAKVRQAGRRHAGLVENRAEGSIRQIGPNEGGHWKIIDLEDGAMS